MLTKLREQIKIIPTTHIDVWAQINHIGMFIEPEVDLGTLQRACPEIGHYFRYIENKIQLSDAKWSRRVQNDHQDYYIKHHVLWHISNRYGKTRAVQDHMHQRVLPVCLRQKILHNYHTICLCHSGMDRTLMAIRNQYYWHKMKKDIRRYDRECTECQQGKYYADTRLSSNRWPCQTGLNRQNNSTLMYK